MLITDIFFIKGSVNDSSNLRKSEAEYRYSLWTIGLIRKHLDHLVSLLGVRLNQGEVR